MGWACCQAQEVHPGWGRVGCKWGLGEEWVRSGERGVLPEAFEGLASIEWRERPIRV